MNRSRCILFTAITVLSPRMGSEGWPFASADNFPGAEPDPLYDSKHIRDLYLLSNPEYEGRSVVLSSTPHSWTRSYMITVTRFTVPVLWDKKTRKVVNNESAEIVRILNTAFNDFLSPEKSKVDVYPEHLRAEIDALHEWIYPNINGSCSTFLSSKRC